jgi:hypothetical protein
MRRDSLQRTLSVRAAAASRLHRNWLSAGVSLLRLFPLAHLHDPDSVSDTVQPLTDPQRLASRRFLAGGVTYKRLSRHQRHC